MRHALLGPPLTSHRNVRPTSHGIGLVELLVVIGIIALLIAILVPVLNRSRESAKRIQCLSNLRGLGSAMMMYATDNNESFPIAADSVVSASDWVYWQAGRDRSQSPIAKYLGGEFNERMLVCPSDEIDSHAGPVVYPFSYTLNARIGGALETPTKFKPLFAPIRFTAIVRPSEKILMIDESSEGIDDGAWAPTALVPEEGHSHNMISNRHDRRAETIRDARAGMGNAIFADGHGDYVERRMGLMEQYVDPRK